MNDRVGALFSWDECEASNLSSRVGISFISIDRAESYIRSEIPSWNLQDTVSSAVEEWNDSVLGKMHVPLDEKANMTNVIMLYTSLYMLHLMPSDRSGENPLWQSDEPFWDDYYTLCQYPICLRCHY